MTLDALASLLCGWLALCLFGLHVISSPKRQHWMTLPEYVRRGLLVTGVMFTWRSVNFATLGGHDMEAGHINVEGMMALIAITYTITAVAVWLGRKILPARGWARLSWVERKEREDPQAVPVVLAADEVLDLARAKGIHVNGEPPPETRH